MKVRPYPLKHAIPFCRRVHRRLQKLQGGMWSVALHDRSGVRGVAVVGRPNARHLDDGLKLQVLRVAVVPRTPNGCSMLYGACSRAAREMGASDLLTYIHHDETGVSLKAAGWIEDKRFKSAGGEWSRRSGRRAAAEQAGGKRRWWAPRSETAKALLNQWPAGTT